MKLAYFEITAESARRESDRIQRRLDEPRQIPVLDPTERAMHAVHDAVLEFDRAIVNTTSTARLAQLEERAAAFEELWAKLREQARDKTLAIERLDGLFKEGA